MVGYLVPRRCRRNGTATYLFSPVTNMWTASVQDTSSLSVYTAGAGVTYDSKRGLLMAFGGNNYVTSAATPQLWSYSVTQNTWTRLSDAPVAAMAPSFAYDSHHDVFLALVGNNTYIYNPATNQWSQFPASLNRPVTEQLWQTVVHDPAHDLFVFEGGTSDVPLIALFRYQPGVTPPLTFDTTSPNVAITLPANGGTVTGLVTISANATDSAVSDSTDPRGVVGVQFQVDGTQIGSIVATTPYQVFWNSTTVANGAHTLSATAIDEVGNTATTSISVTVNNPPNPPVLANVSVTSITGSTATISWTTSARTDTQVAYGLNSAYGALSGYGSSFVTSHSVILSGLSPLTVYHFQALSRDSLGNLGSSSGDLTFTTADETVGPRTVLQLHADNSEVSGTTNGSIVTPSVTPSGLTGKVVVNGGSINFTPA